MENAGYTSLTRQSGLLREMQLIANNIANSTTTGYRREGMIFSEYIKKVNGEASLSMARGNSRHLDLRQAGLDQTGGSLDLAIQGEGFFLLATPDGERLTRAGAFLPSEEGNLVNASGHTLLDAGRAPIALPAGAKHISIAEDGTMSADETPVAQIGLWQPVDPLKLRHDAGTIFAADEVEPAEGAVMRQGFLEASNVSAIGEISRMITVQRSYELGQKFLDAEDQRQRNIIQTLGK